MSEFIAKTEQNPGGAHEYDTVAAVVVWVSGPWDLVQPGRVPADATRPTPNQGRRSAGNQTAGNTLIIGPSRAAPTPPGTRQGAGGVQTAPPRGPLGDGEERGDAAARTDRASLQLPFGCHWQNAMIERVHFSAPFSAGTACRAKPSAARNR